MREMNELMEILAGSFAPLGCDVEKPRYSNPIILQIRRPRGGPVIRKLTVVKTVYGDDDLLENWINNERSRFPETRDVEYKLPPRRN
jgi:hypothetical protein